MSVFISNEALEASNSDEINDLSEGDQSDRSDITPTRTPRSLKRSRQMIQTDSDVDDESPLKMVDARIKQHRRDTSTQSSSGRALAELQLKKEKS